MQINDYVKTEYVDDKEPYLEAKNLNNSEDQVEKLTQTTQAIISSLEYMTYEVSLHESFISGSNSYITAREKAGVVFCNAIISVSDPAKVTGRVLTLPSEIKPKSKLSGVMYSITYDGSVEPVPIPFTVDVDGNFDLMFFPSGSFTLTIDLHYFA